MLALLNAGGDHRVASLARAVNLPRSTAFRLLCTLVEEGYVWRDPATDVYHPTARVLTLSDGFDAAAQLVQAARPVVTELGKELIWPVALATLSGSAVLLRQTTDADSPLAVLRLSAGHRSPVLDQAAGLVLLAYTDRQQSQMVVDMLFRQEETAARGSGPADAAAGDLARRDVAKRLAAVRGLGYACVHRPGLASERSSLAVPIRAGSDTLAALTVRFARNAVTQEVIMDRFLPALRRAARSVVERFERVPADAATQTLRAPALVRTEA
jgi:IclR family mhp operon transcriptional activator